MDNIKNLSVVIPAYNEERRIVGTLKIIRNYLKKRKIKYEILVVDDGSKDDTRKVVEDLGYEDVKVLDYGVNKGKGCAVRYGMIKAKCDYVLFSDADLSTPIEMIERFEDYLKDYDIIIGSRALYGADVKVHQPFYRELAGKTFNLLVKIFAVRGIKDTQCGFKLFKNESAKKIFSKCRIDRFGFDVEALYLARKSSFKIKEVPVVWVNSEDTKLRLFKDSIRMFSDVVKIRFYDVIGCYN